MKRNIIINFIIMMMAIPIAMTVTVLAGATQSVLKLAGTALNPFSTGIFSHSLLQTFVLVSPLLTFLMLTIVAVKKEKKKTSYLLATLTSASWVFLMMSALFVKYGP